MYFRGLVRPVEGRMIVGVCAGIADFYGLSRTGVRLAWLLLSGGSFAFYVVLWMLIPSEY